MIPAEVLAQRISMPLEAKIAFSQLRIREFYEKMGGQVYVAFSGGKDSTVLLHLVRDLYPDVKAVFCNTGLEYPEVVEFALVTENVVVIKPAVPFTKVIEKYGYPAISKEQSQYVSQYRTTKSDKLRDIRWNGRNGAGGISKKWRKMIDVPYKISPQCCTVMKKRPFHIYEKETGLSPIIGTMVTDSSLRKRSYLKNGCNVFINGKEMSRPMSIWTTEDVWEYIKKFNVPYSSIYDMGYVRTGCMFCMFGAHLEKHPNRFELMKDTHPKQYDYCINKLGCKKVLDDMGVTY